jgi:hypothetical protein
MYKLEVLTLVSPLAGGQEKWGQRFGLWSFPPGRWLDTLHVVGQRRVCMETPSRVKANGPMHVHRRWQDLSRILFPSSLALICLQLLSMGSDRGTVEDGRVLIRVG